MPHLNKLVEANKGKPVIFLAPAPEDEDQVRRFLKRNSFDYDILPSSMSFISALGVHYFPTHLIVDKKGFIRQVFIGFSDDIAEKLQREIDALK
jgi:hypothetical protein